ncbi:chondroadherin-like [Anoplophora glabripennis]|uniref:chondroadherin-like n=1 Tax=Anoplophora glabripennis TaxID=217634 RepID=UPI00087599F0|nr:chondroadherin-like [Anoplophora glabripennis]
MRKAFVYALVLLTAVVSAVDSVLLKKGWYRTQSRGRKITLNDVEVFDESTVPDSDYLRVGGRIPTLSKGSVRNLSNATILKFSFCGVTNVLAGAFENLPKLEILALLDNEIDHVRAGVFNNMNLTTLYLQRNQIATIDTKAFDDMPRLYKLKLNSNKISVWDPNWFHNSPSLTEVLFRRNNIQSIPSKAFQNIKGSHVYQGTYLVDTKIYLSKNSISYISPDALYGLEELSQLWLDRNRLTELDEGIFAGITQMSILFLSKNKLKALPSKMFPKLTSDIDILDLTHNNNITCLSYDIVSAVKLTNVQDVRRLDCECVQKLVDRLKEAEKVNEIKADCKKKH